jgi:hypothetical protein
MPLATPQDYGTLDADTKAKVLSESFEVAQKELDIPQVVDARCEIALSLSLSRGDGESL